MAAPTFVSSTSTALTNGTTPKTTSNIAVNDGDVLVAHGLAEHAFDAITIATSSGSTSGWTQQQIHAGSGGSEPQAVTWTATATATGNIQVQFSRAGAALFGGVVKVWRDSDGVGASNKAQAAVALPSVSVTTTAANSALEFCCSDWTASAGTATFTASSGTPVSDLVEQSTAGTNYCCYSSHVVDAGAIGSKTMGMSSPSMGIGNHIEIVLEVKGSTGGLALPDPDVWEFVGVSNVVEVTTASHALVTTGISGLAEGDLMIACIASRIASTTQITLPSAEWTRGPQQMANNTLTTTSAVASGLMAWCIRGASNPSLTFTHPTAPSVAIGRIVAYRNVHRGKPLNTSAAATTATATTAVSVAGITTTEHKCLIVTAKCGGQEAAWSAHDAATDPTTSSGTGSVQTAAPIEGTWQERQDSSTVTGADTSLAIADAVKTLAGATGNITATASLGAAHVVLTAAFNLAMRPNAPVVSQQAVVRAAFW